MLFILTCDKRTGHSIHNECAGVERVSVCEWLCVYFVTCAIRFCVSLHRLEAPSNRCALTNGLVRLPSHRLPKIISTAYNAMCAMFGDGISTRCTIPPKIAHPIHCVCTGPPNGTVRQIVFQAEFNFAPSHSGPAIPPRANCAAQKSQMLANKHSPNDAHSIINFNLCILFLFV